MTDTRIPIPDEVVEAAAEVICNADDPDGHAWKTASEPTARIYCDVARAAIAACLAAWPGMRMMVDIDTGDDAAIKLPLTEQEKTDDNV